MTEIPVSSAELARVLRLSPRRIEQLAGEGIALRLGRGQYDLAESVGRYCDHLRAAAESATSTASAALTEERLKALRLRRAERERQLIPTEEALDVVTRLTGSFVAALGGLPAQISDKSPERRRIAAVIDVTRQRLADEFSEIARELEAK